MKSLLVYYIVCLSTLGQGPLKVLDGILPYKCPFLEITTLGDDLGRTPGPLEKSFLTIRLYDPKMRGQTLF